MSASPEEEGDVVVLTREPLEGFSAVELVGRDGAGAVATFVGTTRDTFGGRRVVRLEYEAYEPMAEKELRALCAAVRGRWKVEAVAVLHRLGVVEVGRASVVVAVSSVHRREALEAVHWAIDELKARVPIWKREVYEDGSEWKQNAEFDAAALASS